jgi:phage pi2 protein 07
MELNTDDYENIWLRLKDKFQKWVFIYVLASISLPVTILTYVGLDELIDNRLEKRVSNEVEKILHSPELSKRISENVVSKLGNVSDSLNSLQKEMTSTERRVKDLAKYLDGFPVEISETGISISSSDNQQLIIEKGISEAGGEIKFSKSFSNIPSVLISEYNSDISSNKNMSTKVVKITNNGFKLYPPNVGKKVSWIAVGVNNIKHNK